MNRGNTKASGQLLAIPRPLPLQSVLDLMRVLYLYDQTGLQHVSLGSTADITSKASGHCNVLLVLYGQLVCMLQVRGKMSCLLINDIDAGLGHFANTQVSMLTKRACHMNSMHRAATEVQGV